MTGGPFGSKERQAQRRERWLLVLHMRRVEKCTFTEIGKVVGTRRARAAQLFAQAERWEKLHTRHVQTVATVKEACRR